MRHIVRVTAAAVLLLALSGLHRPAAQDVAIEPEKNLAKELKNLAETCYKCGENARDKGVYTYARSFYDYALRYDTDHRDCRRVLGFKKKGKDWMLSGELGVPSSNTCKPGTENQLLGKLWEETRPMREKSADALYKFVEDKKLDLNQRLLALHHLLLICDTHARGRAALDHFQPEGTAQWVSRLDEAAYKARAGWLAAAKVEKISENTAYDEKMGVNFDKYRGERVVVHVRVEQSGEALAERGARMGDAALVRVHELLGLELGPAPSADTARLHYTMVGTREGYRKFVETCANIKDDNVRKEALAASGCSTYSPGGTVWFNNDALNDSQSDAVAHAVGSLVVARQIVWRLYWLTRGFGYYTSAHMMGTTRATVFTTKSSAPIIDSGGINSLLGLGTTPEGWRFRVARTAAAGKLATLSQMTQASARGYDEQRIAQAFCMAEYLVTRHGEQLAAFLKASADDSKKRRAESKADETPAESQARLLEHLGMSEDAFNKAFGEWVLANYIKLPS